VSLHFSPVAGRCRIVHRQEESVFEPRIMKGDNGTKAAGIIRCPLGTDGVGNIFQAIKKLVQQTNAVITV
jgi:hypothetical protein